ncbi:sulfurtransferase-like selenium metabolism protein YedF [Shewanella sp. MEBiC00475]|uniref:sulfurtransferase-like selenium metabolism protein YedF n=1 Tax=Shewanella sp. MEBiC00475 TaxID=2575361 RepID=UPI0010BF6A75|nr:sulfurtransferase-like selenium metabolism protein YedF [Shewanella sp. MEBiC00475]
MKQNKDKLVRSVINISSSKMGVGDDDLGDILMQSFINSLIQLDPLPSTIILYNSGVLLCTNDSAVLESLNALEAKGVNILLCGTCADFYNIKDKIGAGTISNMYTIVETLNRSDKIINP